MKILIVTQYFWPENFRINDLALSLQERGHEITVLTGLPNYPQGKIFDGFSSEPNQYVNYKGIEVIRVPLIPRGNCTFNLILNYISFFISCSLLGSYKIKNREFDIVFACQLSPITAVIPGIVIKKIKNIPLVMWSLDLWPETLQAANIIKSKTLVSIVGRLVSFIYSQCDLILGQSVSYLEAIHKRNKTNTATDLFPNWAEGLFENDDSESSNNRKFTIIFAGNVGDAQDFESVVLAAKKLKYAKVNVVFSIIGDGRKLQWLKDEINESRLQDYFNLYGQHPLESMPQFYSKADVALVSLKDISIFEKIIPGKVQSYMVAKLPILSMLNGEGRKVIEAAGCGLTCKSSDYRGLADNIVKLTKLPKIQLLQLGQNGYAYAKLNFDKELLVNKLEKSLSLLVDSSEK